MTLILADRVRETSVTSGTGALSLSAVSGFQRFRDVCSIGDEVDYLITDGTSWEVGIGVYSDVDTLTRTHVRRSSNSNNVVSLSSNSKDVRLCGVADRAAGINNLNKIVNSSFRFWQRGTSLTLADGAMGPDGWFVLSESGNVLCYHSTNFYGTAKGRMALGQVSSTQRLGFGQVLWTTETYNSNGGASTWWFQCHAESTGVTSIRAAVLYHGGTTDNAVRDLVNNWASTTYTANNFFHSQWTPLAVGSVDAFGNISFPVTISSGFKNIGIFIWTESQITSGQELVIEEPILSPMAVPQIYSPSPWEVEFAACQRRYFKTFEPDVAPAQNIGNGRGALRLTTYGAGVGHLSQNFPVLMGKIPTITTYNIGAADANWRDTTNSLNRTAGTTGISRSGFAVTCDTPATAMAVNVIHATAEAEPCS